jgi:hypothetical protein
MPWAVMGIVWGTGIAMWCIGYWAGSQGDR